MKLPRRLLILCAIAALAILGSAQQSGAHPSRFTNLCSSCHSNDTPTCNGCHHHTSGTLSASADHATYYPGSPVTVTLNGGTEYGWIRAILYDQNNQELTRRSGPTGQGDDGQANAVEFPVQLQAPAPATPGDYVWKAAWFGNNNGSGHMELGVNVTIHVIQNPADVTDDAPSVRRTWGRIRSQYR